MYRNQSHTGVCSLITRTLHQVSIEQQAQLGALGRVLLSEFIKPNIYSEQIDWNIAANVFSIVLYIVLYIAHYVLMTFSRLLVIEVPFQWVDLCFSKSLVWSGACSEGLGELSSVCNEAEVKASSWETFFMVQNSLQRVNIVLILLISMIPSGIHLKCISKKFTILIFQRHLFCVNS